MKKRWKVISAVVISLLMLTLAAVPALAQTTATRDIADQTLAPGESTNVTITINNAQLQALGLDEDAPAGWTVAEVNNGGGQYNATLVEWFWMQAAAGTVTVTYNVTVPAGTTAGTYTISGSLFSNEGTVAVGGESQITVSGAAPPADTTATRNIADQALAPGGSTNVTVTIDNAQVQALGLDEDTPAGWTVAAVDNGGGQYNATLVEWFWQQAAAGTVTVTYNVTVPTGAADGDYTISGTLVSGEGTVTVGGETTITVSTAPQVVELTFTGSLSKGETDTLLTPDIPAGVTALDIQLDATADLDLGLWDGTTHVIGWKARISSTGTSTGTYSGDTFAYSGWDGGDEYITSAGPLARAYGLKVYGFKAGSYVVTVSYVPAGPDFTAPAITITAPDVSLGSAVTITVSASDPSGVSYMLFAVLSDVVDVASAYGTGGEVTLTFTPQAAGTYTVEAWAEDMVGNITPEGTPETATFVVD